MEKQNISEHRLQYAIHTLLSRFGIVHFETDVMDALKYFGRNQRLRLGYISHHKKMGYTVGQPDLVVLASGKVYFVELKTEKGRQSKEQRQFQEIVTAKGYNYLIWRSLDDCLNFIKERKNEL